jgi:hypothetical protein
MVRQRSMFMFWQVLAVMMSAGGSRSGCAVAGMVVAAEKEAGERVDGFEQQCVDPGLLVSGVVGVVAGDEMVPSGGCLLLVLGGLVSGLVAGPPPAQCLGAGHDLAGGLALVSLG